MGSESVARLAASLGVELDRRSQQAFWNTVRLPATAAGETTEPERALTLYLARPAMYMNECGRSVRSLVGARNVALSHLLVVWDHMDLPWGQLRFRPAGGPGGHNGMRSVIHHLDTRQFPRLAVGIGRPPGRLDPAAATQLVGHGRRAVGSAQPTPILAVPHLFQRTRCEHHAPR